MLELQNLIFDKQLSRFDLYNYKNTSVNCYKVSVYRNHSFELIEHTINLYLNYADIKADFVYSDYDDSMSFINLDLNSDLIIIWIDLTRYKNDVDDFVTERLKYLSYAFNKNILFIPFGKNIMINSSNVVTYSLDKVKQTLQNKYLDERLEPFSGTKLSSKALMKISKDLGLNYIPACLKYPIKAIVLDLDNTLYSGVLGEDGYKNLKLTEGHKKLQEKLVEFSKKGFFICIASKNEEKDVIDMFDKRKDFPLKLDNITKLFVSWNSKTLAISEIQKFLKIGVKDILFIDDNIGELISMKTQYPDINIVLANLDANKTFEILNNYPRLLKFNIGFEDTIRKKDIQSNKQREYLKKSLSKEDFFKKLEIKLTYSLNKISQIKRVSELANKTNQFICSYKRYSEKEIENLMKNDNYLIITISLKDNLSDSGIIGSLIFKNENDFISIEEAFISCRALGRGIDENIVLVSIQTAIEYFNKKKIKFNFVSGERNVPAERFLDKYLKQYKNQINVFDKKIKNDFINIIFDRSTEWKKKL